VYPFNRTIGRLVRSRPLALALELALEADARDAAGRRRDDDPTT
jgi:hypothetical protein